MKALLNRSIDMIYLLARARLNRRRRPQTATTDCSYGSIHVYLMCFSSTCTALPGATLTGWNLRDPGSESREARLAESRIKTLRKGRTTFNQATYSRSLASHHLRLRLLPEK